VERPPAAPAGHPRRGSAVSSRPAVAGPGLGLGPGPGPEI